MQIRQLYQQFKTVINFLLIFMLSFFILSAVYDFYLHRTGEKVDGMSSFVARQAADLLGILGFEAHAFNPSGDKSSHIIIDGFARVKVIEGCNGLSVMILYFAFLLGFPGRLRSKLWFIPAGLFVIHLFNVFRVAILGWAVYRFGETGYPIYKEMFTASIYLLVLALWYLWVNKFGLLKTKKT